jgi:hypothetical protein
MTPIRESLSDTAEEIEKERPETFTKEDIAAVQPYIQECFMSGYVWPEDRWARGYTYSRGAWTHMFYWKGLPSWWNEEH